MSTDIAAPRVGNAPTDPILSVQDLRVSYLTRRGAVDAVHGVDLELHRHEILGLVGESGSGKSTVAAAVLNMVPPPGLVAAGRVLYRGRDILSVPERELQHIRGREVALIPQDCRAALNPLLTVGHQLKTIMRAHSGDVQNKTEHIVRLLGSLGFSDPLSVRGYYPDQLSGGMAQRVLIAYALCRRPQVLVADEPTTGLDPPLQTDILNLMVSSCRDRGVSMLLITHDINVVARCCQKLAIMQNGLVVEYGAAKQVLAQPRHAYSRMLLDSSNVIGSAEGAAGSALAKQQSAGENDSSRRPRLPLTEVAPGHWVRPDA